MCSDSLDQELFEQRTREACRELERRVRTGERRASEGVLADNPDLADRRDFALELIYTEFVTRDELGQRPEPAELYERFPAWQDRLKRLLRVHEVLGDDELDNDLLSGEAFDTAGDADLTLGSVHETEKGKTSDHLQRIGPYEVLEKIGHGGMGVVYRARHLELDRVVALKMIPPAQNDREHRLRFRREAESAARLQHPNIVQVFEVGDENGLSYLAMEYVAGGSLEERLKGTLLPEREATVLVAKLAEAIHFAHELGVVHRDLKPGNVLLRNTGQGLQRSDSRGESSGHAQTAAGRLSRDTSSSSHADPSVLIPKITDFGLAKRSGENAGQNTRTGAILGTPAYMAPEQATGKVREIGPAADIYSLGAILYESLVGRPPFHAANLLETLEQVRLQDPVPLTRLRPAVSRDIETICLKCLQKRPVARYASAQALADDLRRALAGQPIIARPTGPFERAYKWAKRRPTIASLIAAMFFVAIVGFTAVLWQWKQAEHRREEMENALQIVEAARKDERRQREKLSASAYFNRISLAHREITAGDLERGGQLFEASRNDPHRGWEWSYLDRLLHCERRTLTGHDLLMYGLDFSPDGKLLASVSGMWGRNDPGQVIVWDAASGDPRFQLGGHPAAIMGVAFSPDGRMFASAGGFWSGQGRGQVKIWDASTGEEIATLESQARLLMSVAFHPQGSLIAASGGRTIQIWESPTYQRTWTLDGHTRSAFEVRFSPDGKYLASAGTDRTVRVWDPITKECLHVFQADSQQRSVDFSPDGRYLAAGGWAGTIRLWDVNDDFREIADHPSYEGAVWCVRFTPDGQYLALATNRGTIRLLEPLTGNEHVTLRGHRDDAACLALSPDGNALASGGTDRFVNVWDLTSGQNPVVIGVHNHIGELAFSPDGNLLAVAAKENTARLGMGEKVVTILDLPGRKGLKHLRGHSDWLTSVAFHPDGRHIATGSDDNTARIWDVEKGETTQELAGHTDAVTDVAYSPNGVRLATSGRDKTIRLWDVASGETIATWEGHSRPVTCVEFHPQGQLVLSASEDHTAIIWDVATGAALATLRGHTDALSKAKFSPDGRHIATAGADHQVILWEMAGGEDNELTVARKHTLRGHAQPVQSIAFTPDGSRLASGEWISIKLWDVASGYEALSLDRTDHRPFDLAFSPDGKRLASGNVALWSIEDWPTNDALENELMLRRHLNQARNCETTRNWYGAAWHLSRLLNIAPDQNAYLVRRGRAYAEQEKWELSADDFAASLELSADNRSIWYYAALLHLRQDDEQGYRDFCQQLVDSHGKTEDLRTANSVAWNCALAPDAVNDYEGPLKLAEHVVAHSETGRKHLYLNTHGALLYRAGKFDAAVDALSRGIQAHGEGGVPLDWIFLAMAHHRLGEDEDAADWLRRAVDQLDAPADPDDPPPSVWDRVETQLLRQEAEHVLTAQPAN